MPKLILNIVLFSTLISVIFYSPLSSVAQNPIGIEDGIVINEILADPNGRANFDTDHNGSAETEDEFIEIANIGTTEIDISGFELWDQGAGRWFIFPENTRLGVGNVAAVIIGVQPGGILPSVIDGNYVFDAGRRNGVINNSGDNIVLYDPRSDTFVQVAFSGATVQDPVSDWENFSRTATLIGEVENWGNAPEGTSLTRSPDDLQRIVVHTAIGDTNASPASIPSQSTINAPVLNEFVVNHVGSDTSEYVEVLGDPDTDYSRFTLLQIEGDGTAAGRIDSVIPLGRTNEMGIWTSQFYNGEFENGTLTFLIVEGFSGRNGAQLTIDANGVPEDTMWIRIVDSLAIFDGDTEDTVFSEIILDPYYDLVEEFHPGGASRFVIDGKVTWVRNNFDGEGLPCCSNAFPTEPNQAINTPNQENILGS